MAEDTITLNTEIVSILSDDVKHAIVQIASRHRCQDLTTVIDAFAYGYSVGVKREETEDVL